MTSIDLQHFEVDPSCWDFTGIRRLRAEALQYLDGIHVHRLHRH
jgi:hypothetical protein